MLAFVSAAFCWAQAAVFVRRFPPIHPVSMNALGMTTGATLLVTGSVLVGEPIALPQRAATWVAVSYLAAIGSVVMFVLYLVVLEHWTASRAAYVFVLIPVVALLLSAWLDDEEVTAQLLLGGLLVGPARGGGGGGMLAPSVLRGPRCYRRRQTVPLCRSQGSLLRKSG